MRMRWWWLCSALVWALVVAAPAGAHDVDASSPPPPPAHFAVSEAEPAGRAARFIAGWAPTRPRYRVRKRLGTWLRHARVRWSVSPTGRCLAELAAGGVRARPLPYAPTPAPTPVIVESPIVGVVFHKRRRAAPLVVACDFARRLPAIARVLRAHGVARVEVSSAYRREPSTSFHHLGLGLDVTRFWSVDGDELSVLRDFEQTPGHETCAAPASSSPRGATLRAIACEISATLLLSTVITPNYDAGHRDHFHLDARPDDPRVFVR